MPIYMRHISAVFVLLSALERLLTICLILVDPKLEAKRMLKACENGGLIIPHHCQDKTPSINSEVVLYLCCVSEHRWCHPQSSNNYLETSRWKSSSILLAGEEFSLPSVNTELKYDHQGTLPGTHTGRWPDFPYLPAAEEQLPALQWISFKGNKYYSISYRCSCCSVSWVPGCFVSLPVGGHSR